MSRADRRLLKKAGFGREYKEMGALACALEEVKNAPYVPGYAVEADVAHGVRTRRRVRRERWNRMGRCVRRMLVLLAIYMAVLAGWLLVIGLGWELLSRLLE